MSLDFVSVVQFVNCTNDNCYRMKAVAKSNIFASYSLKLCLFVNESVRYMTESDQIPF